MVPTRPSTGASARAVLAEEEKLDLSRVDRVVAEREVFDLRGLDVESLDLPELEVERIPEGATVLDLRSKAEYASWHYPGALRLDFAHAFQARSTFDRGQTYVLYCELGLKSAHLAELMRKEGLEAYHFKGGLRALQRTVK
jgi:thiamine biosynthesis protein ThiI